MKKRIKILSLIIMCSLVITSFALPVMASLITSQPQSCARVFTASVVKKSLHSWIPKVLIPLSTTGSPLLLIRLESLIVSLPLISTGLVVTTAVLNGSVTSALTEAEVSEVSVSVDAVVGFVDGNVSGPRFVEQADSIKAPDIINTDIP